MKELSQQEINEQIDSLIKKIYTNSDLRHKQAFLNLLNNFRFYQILFISESNCLYSFFDCHRGLDFDSVHFIEVCKNADNDLNLKSTEELNDYLNSDLFIDTFNTITYCLLQGE